MMRDEQYDYGESNSDRLDENRDYMNSPAMTCKVFPVPTSAGPSSSSSPAQFIEHPVSNLDTLAGVAIKYGVEVADIKRMNGLVTDRQMFALKTLQIPLPGRHPPSPSLSNGYSSAGPSVSGKTPPRRVRPDILDSFESLRVTPERKVSSAMSSLQGYYRLRESHARKTKSEGFEMAVYNKESACSLENGSLLKPPSPGMNPPLSLQRKSRSLSNGLYTEEDKMGNHVPLAEFSDPVRRLQKSEADFTSCTPEKLLKEENRGGGWFSALKGKGLALRTKASSRNNLASEAESGGANANSPGRLASIVSDGFLGVRKSSSTPSLQDPDSNSSVSIWSGSKWNLKPDGWSNPITGRKNKAALD